jgi:uncharacterized protein (DUF1919 family)
MVVKSGFQRQLDNRRKRVDWRMLYIRFQLRSGRAVENLVKKKK